MNEATIAARQAELAEQIRHNKKGESVAVGKTVVDSILGTLTAGTQVARSAASVASILGG